MSQRPPRPFALLEAKARTAMLMVGLGFLSFVVGSLFSAALVVRLKERIEGLESSVVLFVVHLALGRFWVLAMLPLVGHAVARFLPLRPVAFAVTAALTGELFLAAIQVASGGLEQVLQGPWAIATRLGTLAAGMALTAVGVRRGLAHAAERQAAAATAATAKQAEYDAYLKASHAIADRTEAKAAEAAPVTPPPEPGRPSGEG